jgi:PTS system galactitol-specific IIA component
MNVTPRQAEPKQGWVRADLVIAPMQAKSAAEAIAQLAACLQAGGFVKASWAQATIEREKTFATGLPTPEVGVAIPHTDIEHVLQQAIAVGILAEPVLFGEMGNPESTVPVRLVCALAVTQSESLVKLLQQLVQMFQMPGVLSQIVGASSPAEIVQIFEDHIQLTEESTA